jgi:hypothetical protein
MKMLVKKLRPVMQFNLKAEPEKKSKVVEMKPKAEKPKKESKKLPPDTYSDEIEPIEISIGDKTKLVFKVQRAGELGLPHVDIRTYVNSDVYVGPTKKGINFPLEFLLEIIDTLNLVNDKCDEKGLE